MDTLLCFNVWTGGVVVSAYGGRWTADGRCSIDINSITTPGRR